MTNFVSRTGVFPEDAIKDPTEQKRRGTNARKVVLEKYNSKRMLGNYLSLYKQLCP